MLHIINHQLLGDSLMATPALKKLSEQGTEYTVYFLDEPIMNIYKHCTWMKNKKWGELPPSPQGEGPGVRVKLESGLALNHSMSTGQHYAYGFAQQLGVTITNPTPDCDFFGWPDQYNYSNSLVHLLNIFGISKKPVLLVFPESSSCSSRSGKKPNKMLPWQTWKDFYDKYRDKYRIYFAAATEIQQLKDYPQIYDFDIQEIAFLVRSASKVLTVDNGIGHVSNAVGANCYLMGGCVPIPWIWAGDMRKTLNCHGNPELITLDHITKLLEQ